MHDTPQKQSLLDRLRLGSIVGPESLKVVSTNTPLKYEGYAVATRAPSWVVDALIVDGATLRQRFAVYLADEGREHVILMTIQHGGTQLNFVLPMSDAGVKAFLVDAIERKALQVVLMHEDSEHFSVLRVDAPFHEPGQLLTMMKVSRPHRSGIAALVDMTVDVAEGRPVPSLVEGRPVDTMLAILAGSEVSASMSKAFGSDGQPLHPRWDRPH